MKRLLPLNHEYSVGSGVFSGIDDSIFMEMDDIGFYKYKKKGRLSEGTLERLNRVDLMSDHSDNEDTISDSLFGRTPNINYSSTIGYYTSLYAGHVKEGNFRKNGSSGGFATWILVQLLKSGEIDGVIHVKGTASDRGGKKNKPLFKYVISSTEKEIAEGAKSRYYPVELSEIMKTIKGAPGRYAVVGIPEFITELRLLSGIEPVFREKIKYTIGLVCGHQKSAKYAESLAWQHGVEPGGLTDIDFREKWRGKNAYDYLTRIKGYSSSKKVNFTKKQIDLFAGTWGHGFFKARFSDFTDNAFNENADITLGDAWLDEYLLDTEGNNIIIVRNKVIDRLIKKAIKDSKVSLDAVDEATIIRSQSGLIHHTREELPYRLSKEKRKLKTPPKKRVRPHGEVKFLKRRVQDVREKISVKSHKYYRTAVKKRDFGYFVKKMQPYIDKYNRLYRFISIQNDIGLKKYFKNRAFDAILNKSGLMSAKEKIRLRTRARIIRSYLKNRKKDGAIITLPGSFNYGNIIQRYALKRFLQKNGLEFNHLILSHTNPGSDESVYDNLRHFVDKFIGGEELEAISSLGYKNYIVGSDQVWRNWYSDWGKLSPYFLGFLGDSKGSRRISYAASFGVDGLKGANLSSDIVEQIKPLLNKFDAVSVREESGIGLVREIVGDDSSIEIAHVLDPTLLLSKEDYSKIIDLSDIKLGSTSSVFGYILDNNQDKEEVMALIAGDIGGDCTNFNPQTDVKYEPVEAWLKGFRDADFVVTDSFHGMVFCIINNTDFIVIGNSARGLARFSSLLGRLGLEDRLVAEKDLSGFSIKDYSKIDWGRVNKRVGELRRESADWLLNNLSKPINRRPG